MLLYTYATPRPIGTLARSVQVSTPAHVHTMPAARSITSARAGSYTSDIGSCTVSDVALIADSLLKYIVQLCTTATPGRCEPNGRAGVTVARGRTRARRGVQYTQLLQIVSPIGVYTIKVILNQTWVTPIMSLALLSL